MDTIVCPYCECRVRTSDVDDEGGVCPECGAVITPSTLVEQDRMKDTEFNNDVMDDEEKI
ncbi:MAG: hypothetical protein R6V56_06655 [Lentisphaeria bacterium]